MGKEGGGAGEIIAKGAGEARFPVVVVQWYFDESAAPAAPAASAAVVGIVYCRQQQQVAVGPVVVALMDPGTPGLLMNRSLWGEECWNLDR